MSDQLVTVATFALAAEAQMARNMLEAEGIPAVLGGEMSAVVLPGHIGQVRLEVRAEDAARATALLAQVTLDRDWEKQAQGNFWVCTACGDAVAAGLAVCSTCATPRDAIRTSARGGDTQPARPPDREHEEGIRLPGGVLHEPRFAPPARPAGRADPDATPKAPGGCALVLVPAVLAGLGLAAWLGLRI
jgi:hypothetical protein